MLKKGVISQGVVCPIVREGADVVDVVINSVSDKNINDKDIIGITESIIARSLGLYVTVDDIARDIEDKFGANAVISLTDPLYSRNRFGMILKGIARAAKEIRIIMPPSDIVGNPSGVNPYTGVDITKYYKEICKEEGCKCVLDDDLVESKNIISCKIRDWSTHKEYLKKTYPDSTVYTLADICSNENPDFGLLGSNKATEEKLKLFPTREISERICNEIKLKIKEKLDKDVIVMIYGDGCYKDPTSGIWEFADPVTSPGYTDKELLEGTPDELKFKFLIDKTSSNEEVETLLNSEKNNSAGKTDSMGTTPRICRDLLVSLMDLTSGSGDRQTPVVLIQNYFRE